MHANHVIPAAALRGATLNYGTATALHGVDLSVERGEVVALLGPNGAGKTSAISLLLGLNAPDSGSAALFGLKPQQLAARQRIGVMLQAAQLPEQLRVSELLQLTTHYYPNPRPYAETARLAGLEGLLSRPYGKLSGGQQRRVQFALTICGRPELIFLDEPTTGLDVESREQLWATIRAEVADGCAVLLTTHYLEEAEALANRVIVLADGRIQAQGTVEQIRARGGQRQLRAISALPLDLVRTWPEATLAEREHHWLRFSTDNAEDLLRRWLAADPQLRELEVRRAGLAEALAEITNGTNPGVSA